MPEVIEIPVELTQFQLPTGVHDRLQLLLDRKMVVRFFPLKSAKRLKGW